MLGPDLVRQFERFRQVFDDNHRAAPFRELLDRRGARQRRQARLRARSATPCAMRARGRQHDRRFVARAMLGLRDQSRRRPSRDARSRRRSPAPRSDPPFCRYPRRHRPSAWRPARRHFPARRSCRPRESILCRRPARRPPARRRRGKIPSLPQSQPPPSPRRDRPRARAAHTITISSTPATRAGIAFISTEDGYAPIPPGT